MLTGLSVSLAERVGHLGLEVADDRIRLRNARFEVLDFPTDGSTVTDQFGNRHRARVLPGTLEIETARPGWLLIETFYRQGEELHRVTEVQSESFPNLRFLTVYARYSGEPPPVNPKHLEESRLVRPAAIRIVPPRAGHQELLAGRAEVETLIVDGSIQRVDFFLDGRRVRQVRKLPFNARISLADPPREQTLEVRAYTGLGALAGSDRITLNRVDLPFGIRIRAVTPRGDDGDAVEVETRVAVPRGATLEQVDFYRNEELAWTVDDLSRYGAAGGFRTVRGTLATPDLSSNDYVRVTAALADGRELEDAQLIEGVTFKGEIDVQLIHLQVLVVDANGAPVDGLSPADFRILENGQQRTVEAVQQAGEVPLILGLAIDSSASMRPIWGQLRSVVGAFLESSLGGGDRAFLVDFDESVRLLQQPTGSMRSLRTSLDRLVPNGGTALNDGILFSLVLYGDQPGRRALVVVTDGVDIDSRSGPELAASFAVRVGIPLYFIDLGRDRIALTAPGIADGGVAAAPLIRTARSADHVRRMEQQAQESGGRVFRIDPELPQADFLERTQRVFQRIREDLGRQQVLTYYTGGPVGAAIEPDVLVVRPGLTVKSVLPLDRVDSPGESTEPLPAAAPEDTHTPEDAHTATETATTTATHATAAMTTATVRNTATAVERAGEGTPSSPLAPRDTSPRQAPATAVSDPSPTDAAVIVSVSGLPSQMAAGGAATVTVTVRNNGSTTWTPFGGYSLGSQSPQDNDTWGLRRAPLSGTVAPNETAAFEFPVTAPEEPDSYVFAWRMVRDPGGWFGSGTGDVPVIVENPSFGDRSIPNRIWMQHEELTPLVFPAASGGEGELSYGLTPSLPAGLSFDLATRTLWGTPSAPQSTTRYTYSATDRNGDTAAISFSITVTAADRDDAAVMSILGLPSRMAAGRQATVTLTVMNTGTTTWTPFGGYALGPESPQDNDTWGLRRGPLSGAVAPNETTTFEFLITAPEEPGSYTFSWLMLRDPGGSFGSGTGHVPVTVLNP